MIELSRHIEKLLVENDCVIVPDFGGFVTHYTPAKRSEEDNLFLPPSRTLGFNPMLRINDGLLVQSVMSVYDLSFPDASIQIEEAVKEMKQSLYENGKIEIGEIGEIVLGMNHRYEFTSYESSLFTSVLYGLDTFYMEEITPKIKQLPVFNEELPRMEASSQTISLNPTFIRTAVAAVAAIFILFVFSPSVENTQIPEENYATFLPFSSLSQLNEYSLLFSPIVLSETKERVSQKKDVDEEDTWQNVRPVTVKEVVVSHPESSEKTGGKTSHPEITVIHTSSPAKYHLIVASLVNLADAQAQVELLKKQGHEGANVISGDNKVRVSICSYANKEEAYRQLTIYREKQGFESAWLLVK